MIPKEKSGYLEVKLPSKIKSLKWKVWRHRWVVLQHLTNLAEDKPILKLTFHAGDKANAHGSGSQQQTVYLEEVSEVTRVRSRTRKYAFTVTVGRSSSPTPVLLLAGSSESQSQSWMAALRACAAPPEVSRDLDIGEVYQDAYVIDGDTSQTLGLTGHYLLVTSQNALSLYSPLDGRLCQEWRLPHLDRYAVDENQGAPEDVNRVLTIVSNGSCPSGTGQVSFFLSDAQEVLSNIRTSIQRTLSRRRAEHVKEILGNHSGVTSDLDNNNCPVRANSCRLPRRGNDNELLMSGVHHRQGSLPCDVEKVALANCLNNGTLLTWRRRTVSSTSSDDNKKVLNCKGQRPSDNQVNSSDLNDNTQRPVNLSAVPKIPSNRHASMSNADKNMFNNTEVAPERLPSKRETEQMSISPSGRRLRDANSPEAPSYFRRPSWYSDTVNADVESSSSEDYHEICSSQPVPQPGLMYRSRSTATSQSSSVGSWINPKGVLLRHPPTRCQVPLESSTSNEADDEVDGDSEGEIKKECARRLTRKSSANSHLYQELPDVNHCEGHAQCKLCNQPPPTPPQLPPRSELQSPTHLNNSKQHPRCKSASVSTTHSGQDLAVKDSRIRSVSENQHTMRKQGSTDHKFITSDNLCKDMKALVLDITSEMPKRSSRRGHRSASVKETNLLHQKVPSAKGATDDKESGSGCTESEYLHPLSQAPHPAVNMLEDEDPLRKVSVFSGLYQDIESIEEGEHCECHPNRAAAPPEPPPRNRDKESPHAKQEYYEDLDRFRKNIHKYLGIPLTEVQPPPPLPHRPLSLPSVSPARQRTKSKLRTIGRKKKSHSTDGVTVSSSQTTDDNISVHARKKVRPVSAWPFHIGSLPGASKLSSLMSDNSFYSTRKDLKDPASYPSQDRRLADQQCASFSCGSCGATNTLYANMPPLSPSSSHQYVDPRPIYPRDPRHQGKRYSDLPGAIPDPFCELLNPTPQPWSNEEQETEQLLRWSAGSALSDTQSPSAYGSRVPTPSIVPVVPSSGLHNGGGMDESESDIYTDMSGVPEEMYMPMISILNTPKQENVYINWPIDIAQSVA